MATSKIFSVLFFVVGLVVLKPGAGETLKLHFQVNIVKRLGLGLGTWEWGSTPVPGDESIISQV